MVPRDIIGMDTHLIKQMLCATAYACTKTWRVGQRRYHKVVRRTPFIGLATCLLTGMFVSHMYIAHTTTMMEVMVENTMIANNGHRHYEIYTHKWVLATVAHIGNGVMWCVCVCGVCMDTHVVKQVLCATAYASWIIKWWHCLPTSNSHQVSIPWSQTMDIVMGGVGVGW